jgi:hypothetical protein
MSFGINTRLLWPSNGARFSVNTQGRARLIILTIQVARYLHTSLDAIPFSMYIKKRRKKSSCTDCDTFDVLLLISHISLFSPVRSGIFLLLYHHRPTTSAEKKSFPSIWTRITSLMRGGIKTSSRVNHERPAPAASGWPMRFSHGAHHRRFKKKKKKNPKK